MAAKDMAAKDMAAKDMAAKDMIFVDCDLAATRGRSFLHYNPIRGAH